MMLNKHTKSRKSVEIIDPPFRDIEFKDKKKGSIDFMKQSPRDSFEKLQTVGNPHEKRFEMISLPTIHSKAQKMPNLKFEKISSRISKDFTANMTPSIYKPNFEYSKQSLSKTGVSWHKVISRPPIISPRKEKELNSSSIDYDSIEKYLNSYRKISLVKK